MSGPAASSSDEHLPKRLRVGRLSPRTLAVVAGCAAAGLIGVGATAFVAGGDDDSTRASGAPSSSTLATTAPSSGSSTFVDTTSQGVDDPTPTSSTSPTAGTVDPPAVTTTPGQVVPTVPRDTSPSTTLPPPASTTPPTPSTSGPDTRSPVEAYAEEYERYCREAFRIAPDGVLYDPAFIDDAYRVDDCLEWLDPEWGEFYDSAAAAAQGGIDDAISTMEDFTSLTYALCWVDPATDDWGGCWYSPNSA